MPAPPIVIKLVGTGSGAAMVVVGSPDSKLSSTRKAQSENRTTIERTKPAKKITDASGIHNVEVSSCGLHN